MNEFKGTQGKWEYSPGDNASVDIVLPNNTTVSIDRYDRYGLGLIGGRDEMEANALLISKAPEMLEMLNRVLFHDPCHYNEQWDKLTKEVEKLIKEATELS